MVSRPLRVHALREVALGASSLIQNDCSEVMIVTLDQVISRLSRSELERLQKCAEHGMYDELLQLLRTYGYDESDSPASIGQKIKRFAR